ncbi:MAG TPA: hypothetical protein VN845_05250 [Solirubrobacteraceae bacterium]|nr:hypothetical protein [Solirubrobacteraceae bacterium]
MVERLTRIATHKRHLSRRLPSALLVLASCAVLALGTGGCGESTKSRTTRIATSTIPGIDTSRSPKEERGTITTSAIPPGQQVRGDGDADNPGDTDGNGDIDPEDEDSDYPVPNSYKFPDSDDRATFAYGHEPSASEAAKIASVVKRYYAAAAADDGAAACRLLLPSFAASVAESYDVGGSPDTKDGKSCQAVLGLLLRRYRAELAEAIDVVEVRVQGETAQVVLSSRKMPASDILLMRRDGSWWVQQPIGAQLP